MALGSLQAGTTLASIFSEIGISLGGIGGAMARKSKYGGRVTGEQYIPEENPRLERLREVRMGPFQREVEFQEKLMAATRMFEDLKGGYLDDAEKIAVKDVVARGVAIDRRTLDEALDRIRRGLPTEAPRQVRREFKNLFNEEMLRRLADIPNLKREIGGTFPVEKKWKEPEVDEYEGLTSEQREILAGMEG